MSGDGKRSDGHRPQATAPIFELYQAVEAEVSEFLAKHADLKTPTAIGASCAMGACLSARS